MTIAQQLHNSATHAKGNDPNCPICQQIILSLPVMVERSDNAIIDLLWDYLKKDPEGYKDRRSTGWGTKTKQGLIASVRRAVLDPGRYDE